MTFDLTQPPQEIIYVSNDGKCGGKEVCYNTIQDAVNAVADATAIHITQATYNENITVNAAQTIYLEGRWNSTFTTDVPDTAIHGSLTISNGRLIVENIVLQ